MEIISSIILIAISLLSFIVGLLTENPFYFVLTILVLNHMYLRTILEKVRITRGKENGNK